VVENTPEKSPGISSSTQSEFVDNSQIPSLTTVEKQKTADVDQPVLLVQQDIQFLKESWANLADIEDQAMLQVPPLLLDKPPDIPALDVNKQADKLSPSNTENDGFQLVTTRKKFDKAKASKPSIHKASHITRSKVGSPKPSK
jgi:trehalose/maltose hydrolase-like predicted phosphorylase